MSSTGANHCTMQQKKSWLLKACVLPLILFLQACPVCNEPEIPMSFNFLRVEWLDNSGQWPQPVWGDTLFAGAIAFSATLADTTMMYMPELRQGFSIIPEAKAMSCIMKFVPRHSIESVQIISLFPLTEDLPAGSDITNLFFALHSGAMYGEHLYLTLDQTLNAINQTPFLADWPQEKISFFLAAEAQHPVVQLEIRFTFSDHTSLSSITPPIHVRQP